MIAEPEDPSGWEKPLKFPKRIHSPDGMWGGYSTPGELRYVASLVECPTCGKKSGTYCNGVHGNMCVERLKLVWNVDELVLEMLRATHQDRSEDGIQK